MQFKDAGNKIQILEYQGYDKEKKRSIIKMIGSLDRLTPEITTELRENLTDAQIKEIQSHIKSRLQYSRELTDSALLYEVGSKMSRLADYITRLTADSQTENQSDRRTRNRAALADDIAPGLWAAMGDLQKALKKAGHPKPKPTSGQKGSTDPRQAKLIKPTPSSPAGNPPPEGGRAGRPGG